MQISHAINTFTLVILVSALASMTPSSRALALGEGRYTASGVTFEVELIVDGLRNPYAIELLEDNQVLVSERGLGAFSLIDLSTGSKTVLEGLPPVYTSRYEGGTMDVIKHPEHASNGWIYIAYTIGTDERNTLAVDRARLGDGGFIDRERLLTTLAWTDDTAHYGGRLAFQGNHLLISVGERHHRNHVRDLSNHVGTILRINDDGSVPADNPFADGDPNDRNPKRPEIYSYGHRNPQGLLVHPDTGEIWSNEHGPRSGDELNRIIAGGNYGWPDHSWGFEYTGGPIGTGEPRAEGVVDPVWVWSHGIGPSDLLVYSGTQFPEWRGNFFIGSLTRVHLNRMVIENGQVLLEERLLPGMAGRIRSLAEATDGSLLLGTDTGDLLRVFRP